MKRAALYIRVSTEEQAMHGYSLDAQRVNLTEYAKKHNMLIVDYYVDEGASARKKYTTRKEFMRMLGDIQAGLIDIILFIKMDRWFRSVADYYKVQEILDQHHVDWKATMEDYDTSTSSGRLNLNIRLSIAQNESEMTSERIKFVFENKRQRGELISGSHPMGYKIEDKHLVIDPETSPIVKDVFDRYLHGETINSISRYYREYENILLSRHRVRAILENPTYIGELYKYKNMVEPLVSEYDFQNVQKMLKRNVAHAPTGIIYIFSGLLVCEECNHRMVGRYFKRDGKTDLYYRCRMYTEQRTCSHKRMMRQDVLEGYLLSNLHELTEQCIFQQTIKNDTPKTSKIDTAKIEKQMERLKELYVQEFIDLDTYKNDRAKLSEQLQRAQDQKEPTSKRKIQQLEKLLNIDFETQYFILSDVGKQKFWRSIFSKILITPDNQITPHFL